MTKTYHGSCHCGAVKYEAEIDLAKGSFKCNCTICAKQRNWLLAVGADAFRLVAGEGNLSEYQFGKKSIHHKFCKTCGVAPFSWSDSIPGKSGRGYVIKISTLDDATPEELEAIPVYYGDGLHDDFSKPPKITSYL